MSVPSILKDLASKTEFLRQLVQINSGTANVPGVNQIQSLVEKPLKELGFATRRIPNPKGSKVSGDLLEGVYEIKDRPFITFVTHADTVFEPNIPFKDFVLSRDGKTATGPGTIDDKGGIVVALSGLAQFLNRGRPSASLRFICTPSEETGSFGFHEYFQQISHRSELVLGFEPSLDKGAVIESRQGGRWYQLEVEGKEAHAGRGHRDGVNAGHDLSVKIDKLQKLTDYQKEVTVSVGHIHAGQNKFNIVCGHAHAKIDTRFPSFREGVALHRKVEKIVNTPFAFSANRKLKTKTSYSVSDDCPPFSKDKASDPFVKAYLQIIKAIEKRATKSLKSGGSADCNYMSRPGIPILDGLGASGGGMHTLEEFIELRSLLTRAQALSQFLEFCSQRL